MLDAAFLCAQYPDGYIKYRSYSAEWKIHVKCTIASPEYLRRMIDTGGKPHLINAGIYRPDICVACDERDVRVRKKKKRKQPLNPGLTGRADHDQ